MQFDLRPPSVMKSVPSAVADGCMTADWQCRNPSATADGTDFIATARPLTQLHHYRQGLAHLL
jgi:hypothetical protein